MRRCDNQVSPEKLNSENEHIKGNLILSGVRRPEGGALTHLKYHRNSVIGKTVNQQTPTRRSINRKTLSVTGLDRNDVHCVSWRKLATPAAKPITCHHPEFLLFSNGLSFKTTPPNFLLFLYKIMFLFFVCWTCL